MEKVFLLLGVNLGDKSLQLTRARTFIAQQVGTIEQISRVYETDAWGKLDQPSFFNQAICVRTPLSPQDLLREIHHIEATLGRVREVKWDARLMDIDILFYGREIIAEENLQIPHPLLPQRKFALVPLAEIAPDWVHPQLDLNIAQLLEQTDDGLEVTPILN